MSVDHTAIPIHLDPRTQRMSGVTAAGRLPFDVPFITPIADNLWQGGCTRGLILPPEIKHLVSLYKWQRYDVEHSLLSELYVEMYDAEEQGLQQVDALAEWVNLCRKTGPVLVHCQAGLNRSSLITARALLLNGDFPNGAEIIGFLRAGRSPAVLCNKAFEAEVRSWR